MPRPATTNISRSSRLRLKYCPIMRVEVSNSMATPSPITRP